MRNAVFAALVVALAITAVLQAVAQMYGPMPRPDCVLHQAEHWVTIPPGESVSYEYNLTGCTADEASGWASFYGWVDPPDAVAIKARHGVSLSVTDILSGETTTMANAVPLRATRYIGTVGNTGKKPRTVRVAWLAPGYLK